MVAALGSPVDSVVRTCLKYPCPTLTQHLADHLRLFLAFEWSSGQAECIEFLHVHEDLMVGWTPKFLSQEVQNEPGLGFWADPVQSLSCPG